ncbi:hypothetical protein TRFO_30925 [Tritrichomonas foetus]|uniref:Uncharacterized protein n=1 Tax=Tritrichomonas foetus TaxID=1144522 RepID=A0A1J4JWY7_9EUKA|nr:hypothetical protein TRFO_30925 [Tritrichomonas foetus]|eukprot:OHT02052.1 hypothetical protein TRFO_30925 [Tritrichomonas foetus]
MVIANAIGDSFLNKCYQNDKFFIAIQDAYTPIFGWTEPYPLLLLLLILLIILPAIFKFSSQGSFLKIYRLYNIIRLGLLSLLHQITYSYTIQSFLSMIIRQPGPCIVDEEYNFSLNDLQFPFSAAMSAAIFVFSVARFSGINKYRSVLYFTIFLTPVVIFIMSSGLSSLFQVITSILISYLLHFCHLYIPFRWIHLENAIVCILNIIGTVCWLIYQDDPPRNVVYCMLFPFAVLLIDEFMIIRHQVTRGGFSTVERPADLSWTIETQHSESIRLLNSDEEENFDRNLDTDIMTAFIAFLLFFSAILGRQLVVTVNFFQAPT